jgi:hypothetical protein
MEKKEIVIEGPRVIGGTTILVVGNVWLGSASLKDRDAFFGSKKPTHVLVISDSERRVFTVDGEEIALEKLMKDVPGLSSYL